MRSYEDTWYNGYPGKWYGTPEDSILRKRSKESRVDGDTQINVLVNEAIKDKETQFEPKFVKQIDETLQKKGLIESKSVSEKLLMVEYDEKTVEEKNEADNFEEF